MSLRHLGVTIGIAASAAIPMSASAVPAPDSTQIAALRSAASEWNAFRVITRRARYDVRDLGVDDFGIVVRKAGGVRRS